MQVGIIQSFNSTLQTASIQIAIKKVLEINDDGTEVLENYPLLVECPVMVLSGGSSHLTLPISKGDTCIVLFNDREIDRWFSTGEVSTTTSYRKHDKSDAIAIIGIRNMQNAISDYYAGGVEISSGIAKLRISPMVITSNVPFMAAQLSAANGATGTFNVVNVVNGIVVSGS